MKSIKLTTSLIAGPAVLAVVITTIYLANLFQKNFEQSIVSQTQQKLLTIAKSTASRLEDFIKEHSEALKALSQNPSLQEEIYRKLLQDKPDTDYCPFRNVYEIHKDDVDALTTLDANGMMLHGYPFIANRPDMDHTDKPGVAYVLREHKPYVSGPFYNNLGKMAISISEPVFYADEFAGIVRWMVQADTIYTRFMQPIQAGLQTCKWLIDEQGILLGSKDLDEVGHHFMRHKNEEMPDHDWSALENILAESLQGKEGTGLFVCLKHGKGLWDMLLFTQELSYGQ